MRLHLLVVLILSFATPLRAEDALSSWNEGQAKKAIVAFVSRVTQPGPDFVKPEDRIAVFDNDGTLWTEWPAYSQLLFALDRVKALAPQHPEWRGRQPFKAALAGDVKALAASGEKGAVEIVGATHAGNTPEAFQAIVSQWLASAEHPRFKARYDRLVYQPMLDLLAYLRANGFKTYIVSGGGAEFLRAFSERVYGVPPEQVVGSTIVTKYEVLDGAPVLMREAKIDFIDDKAGKPVAINKYIGKRPIAAFGNSDGDFQMLEWTTAGPGPRFGLIVHHDDEAREAAYDRKSSVGRLDRALDEAGKRGWTLVSMKNDWKRIFPAP
ncbi:HAD family hydrolase [Methylocystis parvus]|uniref:phosphoserine phosphatase n=1 Tax=Methylocystis parvus TaxID=134 RepID=A0A6B8M1D6_9HYPH|nr:HAD family hydrolase [Methylocystis parvus]QGM96681.1 haloacid dehalogenase-like hydrolase [Methylocystis parvus]WBJ99453.1 haloacid dehalogenase-like hydrolase [Methylocystis parvus OBBP]